MTATTTTIGPPTATNDREKDKVKKKWRRQVTSKTIDCTDDDRLIHMTAAVYLIEEVEVKEEEV
jgi:hypothetical protein